MTFDEALQELGVTSLVDASGARRAYLKLVKTRKPESDPAGFQRAREAWERISGQLENGAQNFFAPPPPTQPASVPSPPLPLPPAGQGPRTEDDFRAEFAALAPGASVEAPLEIARRAAAALPESEVAMLWLVRALLSADRHPDAIDVLRAAADRFPSALWDLALRFPTRLTDEDLQSLGSSAPSRLLWELSDTFCNLDQGARAAEVALLAFDTLKREPDAPPPPPVWLGMLVLRLHEADAPEPARRVASRYERWLRESDLHDAFLREVVGQRWPQVVELGLLPDTLPRLVRAPLARAIAEGPEALGHAFTQFALHFPMEADHAHSALLSAPELMRVFKSEISALSHSVNVRSSGKGKRYSIRAFWFIGVLLGGVWLANGLPAKTPHTNRSSSQTFPPRAPAPHTGPRLLADHQERAFVIDLGQNGSDGGASGR